MKNTFSIDQSPTADKFNAASNCPVSDIAEAPVTSATEAHSNLVKQINRMIYESKQMAFSGLLSLIDDVQHGHTITLAPTRSGMSFLQKTLTPEAMPMNTNTEKPALSIKEAMEKMQPDRVRMDQLGADRIENPIAVINALQKQIEHLEKALRRQNEIDRSSFGMEVSATLNVLRAHAIIPLYLGKQNRNKALEPSSLINGSPLGHSMTVLAEVLRDHLWLLDDAPIPDEMKEALRESCQYGCNRWELQTSSHSQQA
jgi:hypothetical protein